MKVLGISPLDKDSTVSIVEDGNILFAAGEERFSRNKQQSGFPRLALEKALSYTGLSISDFDQVCYPFLTWENEQKLFTKNLTMCLIAVSRFTAWNILTPLWKRGFFITLITTWPASRSWLPTTQL